MYVAIKATEPSKRRSSLTHVAIRLQCKLFIQTWCIQFDEEWKFDEWLLPVLESIAKISHDEMFLWTLRRLLGNEIEFSTFFDDSKYLWKNLFAFHCIKLFFFYLTVYWACTQKKRKKVSYYSSTSLSESFAVNCSHLSLEYFQMAYKSIY